MIRDLVAEIQHLKIEPVTNASDFSEDIAFVMNR